jgi:O-antigen/teichoic acid export membrane protein
MTKAEIEVGLYTPIDSMNIRARLLKNTIANLGRGGATGIVALFLPPLLVRHMSTAEYGVWVLVLQVAAYISYLDLGLQTAVGRYVAYTTEKNDFEQRTSIFSTAFAALSAAAVAGLILLVAFAAAIRLVFPSIPADSILMMRWALLILGTSLALGLPASAWSGVFVGLQRNEIPALVIGGSRLLSAVGVVVAAFAGKSVVVMATIMAITNVVSYAVQYGAMRKMVPDTEFVLRLVRRSTASELLPYCFGLTVMSFSMLLVTGLDLIVVGHFQFSAVTAYSVAASMVTFIAGGLYAALNALMPHAATVHARQKPEELGRLVIVSTQIAVILLVFTSIPVLIYSAPILKAWIGQQYVQVGYPILVVLLIANIIRLIGAPYATVLVSAGQQRLIKISPLTEGVSNLLASLVLGSMMGAIGVALGTLVGSVFGIAAHILYSMPRTDAEIRISRGEYVLSGVITPFLATTPLLLAAAFSLIRMPATAGRPIILLAAAALSLPGSALVLKHSGILRI